MSEKLFVYGTLGPGRPNEHILNDIGGSWDNGTIKGTLIDEGWGAKMGYPAISLDKNGQEVKGFIFTSNNLCDNWGILDDFEGKGYERVVTNVKKEDGSTIEAYVYSLKAK
jgi:gamma-glutamylcyclotransferase (GGCT)/AIG2-like uncharacterized protein YtfP